MKFTQDQEVYILDGAPIYTIMYLPKGKQELTNVSKAHKRYDCKIACDPISKSTAYDANHSYIIIDNYSLWIIKNEDIHIR